MLRLKIIVIIIISIVSLIGILYIISSNILLESYGEIEQAQMLRNTVRVSGAIENYQNSLNIKLRDWAQWDDTFQFIQDSNTDYMESNLANTSLINLELNFMLFANTNNEIIFSKQVDFETSAEVLPIPNAHEFIYKRIMGTNRSENGRVSGFLQLNEGLLLVESLPILPTSGEGAAGGIITFARFLDQELVNKFEELTQLQIDVYSFNDPFLPIDVASAKEDFHTYENYVIKPLSEDTLASYFILYDLNNDPSSIVRASAPRETYAHGKQTVKFFALISCASTLLFGLIILLAIEKLLLQRFSRLSKDVEKISVSTLSKASVYQDKEDEIGLLAKKINSLLNKLSESHEKELAAYQTEKLTSQKLKTNLENTENINKLMVDREIKMIELKTKVAELESKLSK